MYPAPAMSPSQRINRQRPNAISYVQRTNTFANVSFCAVQLLHASEAIHVVCSSFDRNEYEQSQCLFTIFSLTTQ